MKRRLPSGSRIEKWCRRDGPPDGRSDGLVIALRLSTIVNSDIIVVMTMDASIDEAIRLMAEKGTYHRLYRWT